MMKDKGSLEEHTTSTGHEMSSADWLDAHFLAMQPEYEEMLRWVGLQSGWHVLDAACGNGSFLPLITELVGSRGQVIAIDLVPETVKIVEKRIQLSEWPAPVNVQIGSVVDLPYDDDTFDAVWCANTTQYLTDGELRTMLKEYVRVTRPNGLIAIKEYDVTAQQFQPTTPTLFIHLVEALCRNGSQYHCSLLRAIELPKWLREAGLVKLRQKPTLMVRFQPLDSFSKQLAAEFLQYCYQQSQQVELPERETELWQKLGDTNSPDHIFHHPDYQYRAIQTVFVGHVPE